MWGLGQMSIWGNGHFGANGHFGIDEHWGKWALGANAHLGKMSSLISFTRPNIWTA